MHSDLIAKLEALDGPSREVDALIATTIGGFVYEKRGRDQKAWYYPSDGGWRRQLYSSFADKLPAYTASLDAASAIVERVLPGWSWEARRSGFGNGQASVWNPMEQPRPGTTIRADHKSSPAIALLIAALKALEARDG